MGSSSLDAAQLKQIEDESTDEILIHLEVTNEVVATAESSDEGSKLEGTSKAKKVETVLDGENMNSLETLKCCEQILQRRKREPRLIRRSPVEGYCFLKYQKDMGSSSLGKRVQSKKKDSLLNQENDLEQSSKPKKIVKSTLKKIDSVPSKKGKERVIGTDAETKNESSQKEFDSINDSEPSSKLRKTLKSKVKERGSEDAFKKTSKKMVLDGSYLGSEEKREGTRNDDCSVKEETCGEVISEKHEFLDKENDSGPSSKLRKISKSEAEATAKERCSNTQKKTIRKDVSGGKGKRNDNDADDEGSDWKLSSKLKEIMKSKAKKQCCSAPKKIKSLSIDKGKGIDYDADAEKKDEPKDLRNEEGDDELSLRLKKILKFKVKGRKSDAAKKKGKKGIVISGSSSLSAQKGKGTHFNETGDVITPEKLNLEDVGDKMMVSPMTSPKESKNPSNLEEKKKSRRSDADYDGDALVNLRVKVLWPLDKKLYEGTIESFDPLTKKHKVNYDDGDVEILDLREEIWKPFNDRPPRAQFFHKQEGDFPSPSFHAKEQVKTG